MQVYVKVMPDNRIVSIDIEASDDVTLISELVFAQLNINPETDLVKDPKVGSNGYRLVFAGKILEAGRTLSDYNIQKETEGTIRLILSRESAFNKVLNSISKFLLWNHNNLLPQQGIPAAAMPVPAAAMPVPVADYAQVHAAVVALAPDAVMPENYNLSEQVDSDTDSDFDKPDARSSKRFN